MPSATILVRLLALSLAALLASATPTPTTTDILPFNPIVQNINHVPVRRALSATSYPEQDLLTNGQRMARGLPPKSPHFNHAKKHLLHARQSPVPCVPQTGYIRASSGGRSFFIGRTLNKFGEFGAQGRGEDALRVSICTRGRDVFDIRALNPTDRYSAYPFFGGVVGFANSNDNIGPNSYNYFYLSAVPQTPRDSAPSGAENAFSAATRIPRSVESAIWALDPSNGMLGARWVDTDGSVPAQQIRYIPSANAFAVTGDVDAFDRNFGASQPATLTFVAA